MLSETLQVIDTSRWLAVFSTVFLHNLTFWQNSSAVFYCQCSAISKDFLPRQHLLCHYKSCKWSFNRFCERGGVPLPAHLGMGLSTEKPLWKVNFSRTWRKSEEPLVSPDPSPGRSCRPPGCQALQGWGNWGEAQVEQGSVWQRPGPVPAAALQPCPPRRPAVLGQVPCHLLSKLNFLPPHPHVEFSSSLVMVKKKKLVFNYNHI